MGFGLLASASLFGRRAKNIKSSIFISDGEPTTDGLIIGNGDVQSVGFVVDFVDKAAKHGGGQEQRHRKIGAVGDDAHIGINEVAQLQSRNLVQSTVRHAAQAAEGNGVSLFDSTEFAKAFFAIHPNGIDCTSVNHGI